MNPAALNYGPMKRPDDERHTQQSPDFFSAVIAAYHQWLPIASQLESSMPGPYETNHIETVEAAYEEATNILKGSEASLQAATQNDAGGLLNLVRPSDSWLSGAFLSAVHNNSSIPKLERTLNYEVAGFRLKEGKSVVARKRSLTRLLGWESHGSIVNYGETDHMGNSAGKGFYANFGTARTLGFISRDAVLFNFGYSETMGQSAANCFMANYGTLAYAGASMDATMLITLNMVDFWPTLKRGGLRINFGDKPSISPDSIGGGISISHNYLAPVKRIPEAHVENEKDSMSFYAYNYDDAESAGTMKLLGQLLKKVLQLKRFERAASSRRLLEEMMQTDWKPIQGEIESLARQVERAAL